MYNILQRFFKRCASNLTSCMSMYTHTVICVFAYVRIFIRILFVSLYAWGLYCIHLYFPVCTEVSERECRFIIMIWGFFSLWSEAFHYTHSHLQWQSHTSVRMLVCVGDSCTTVDLHPVSVTPKTSVSNNPQYFVTPASQGIYSWQCLPSFQAPLYFNLSLK